MRIAVYSPSMQMGKSTFAKYLVDNYDYKIISLAGTLKKMLAVLLKDLGYSDIEILEFIYGKRKEEVIKEIKVSARYLMQSIGTDWGRNLINKNIWLITSLQKLESSVNYICEDCRKLNEAEKLKELGFKLIKINNNKVPIDRSHSSEGELDNYKFDYEIDNSGTLEAYYENIEKILKEINNGNK